MYRIDIKFRFPSWIPTLNIEVSDNVQWMRSSLIFIDQPESVAQKMIERLNLVVQDPRRRKYKTSPIKYIKRGRYIQIYETLKSLIISREVFELWVLRKKRNTLEIES